MGFITPTATTCQNEWDEIRERCPAGLISIPCCLAAISVMSKMAFYPCTHKAKKVVELCVLSWKKKERIRWYSFVDSLQNFTLYTLFGNSFWWWYKVSTKTPAAIEFNNVRNKDSSIQMLATFWAGGNFLTASNFQFQSFDDWILLKFLHAISKDILYVCTITIHFHWLKYRANLYNFQVRTLIFNIV